MLTLFANLTYRRLFAAQVLSLIGSGLTTVALGLLAYDLAGEHAGAVLGTALMLKMVAYVGVAPVASAVSTYLPRRSLLVGLDVCRAALVFLLPGDTLAVPGGSAGLVLLGALMLFALANDLLC